MGFVFGRALNASFTIALSAVLAPMLLVACALWWSGGLLAIQDGADQIYRFLVDLEWPGRYRAALRQWASPGQFTLVFFLIVARLLIVVIGTSARAAVLPRRRRADPQGGAERAS